MGEVDLQPGWWFNTNRGKIHAVRDYHAAHLAKSLWSFGPRRGRRPPPPPRHLESEYDLQKHALTAEQRARQDEETRRWLTDWERWLRSGKRIGAPAPPRRGSVLADWQGAEIHFYEVGSRARKALACLREVAMLAGGVGRDKLSWSAEEYAGHRRRGRTSLGELSRSQQPLQIARAAMKRAVDDLEAARAAGDAKALARAESERAEARVQLARLRSESARAGPDGESALATFCFRAAEEFAVQAKVMAFVAQYGPLILDFGAWCASTEYGAFVSRHPGSSSSFSSYLLQLGHERFLWPKGWRKWATGCYELAGSTEPKHPIPVPVAFYVWAAYLLTALCEHPEWPGCQLFLANRLASLHLVTDETWFPELTEWTRPRQGRRLSARLYGELLDYLALFAAYRSAPVAGDSRAVMCENCSITFITGDGRRRYCDQCSNRRIYNRVAQRRFRERHRR